MDKRLEMDTIMVVDDTPANLSVLRDMLHGKNYRVLTFPNGRMALNAAIMNPPDIVLLDIMMPEMDGFEVCEHLKAHEALKDIPVLFISALTETTDKVKAFAMGAVDYVSKPFYEDEVLSRIHVHLEIRKQQRKIRQLLNDTLIGSIQVLNELLAVSHPQTYQKSLQVSKFVQLFCNSANLSNAWMYSVAANLLSIGIFASQHSVIKNNDQSTYKINNYELMTAETMNEAARIIGCIPGLKVVSSIIKKSADTKFPDLSWREWPKPVIGGQLLRISNFVQSYIDKGLSERESLIAVLESNAENLIPVDLLRDFGIFVFQIDFKDQIESSNNSLDVPPVIEVGFADVIENDVLAQDLYDISGTLLLRRGMKLTSNIWFLIKRRDRSAPVVSPVKVFRDSHLQATEDYECTKLADLLGEEREDNG